MYVLRQESKNIKDKYEIFHRSVALIWMG